MCVTTGLDLLLNCVNFVFGIASNSERRCRFSPSISVLSFEFSGIKPNSKYVMAEPRFLYPFSNSYTFNEMLGIGLNQNGPDAICAHFGPR